jgi:hypothetical protein
VSAQAIANRAFKSAKKLAEGKAESIRLTALELHESAPRGGDTLNAFGQPRSAPGEPPAREYGSLTRALNAGSQVTPRGARAPVNYLVLERGYAPRNLEPRPLGRIALDRVKARR